MPPNSKLEIIVILTRTGLKIGTQDSGNHILTIAAFPYRYSRLYKKIIKKANVAWPVLVRPGRQRLTRACFDSPVNAIIYGKKLAERYGKIYGQLSKV